VKNNLSAKRTGLDYRLMSKKVDVDGEMIAHATVEWLGENELNADDLAAKEKEIGKVGGRQKEKDKAAEFLAARFAELAGWQCTGLYQDAEAKGIGRGCQGRPGGSGQRGDLRAHMLFITYFIPLHAWALGRARGKKGASNAHQRNALLHVYERRVWGRRRQPRLARKGQRMVPAGLAGASSPPIRVCVGCGAAVNPRSPVVATWHESPMANSIRGGDAASFASSSISRCSPHAQHGEASCR